MASAESVKVIVRCRPLNERENGLKCRKVVEIENSRGQCGIHNLNDSKAPPKIFFFDGAYDETSTTEQLYSDIVYPLVENVTEGYNGTVFAYGQTGCGKSYTMQGVSQPESQRGVIPRAFDHLFETISVSEKAKYLVHASYLEIYNEEIRDLLAKDTKANLDLKEHPEKGVYVANLSMHKVSNVRECQVVMDRGWKNRSTGATLMNVDSSRSHSIFTIYIEMIETNQKTGKDHIRAGKLNLVDLAGSERQSKTGSTGERLKEANKINLSLSALGNVISALVDGKSKHIPYRDSKLTRMLQDSLGGNTKTLMIACLSPADNNYDETLSTLRYANRAKNIQNKPKINEDPKDALLRQYQEEINRLKMMLEGKAPPSEPVSNKNRRSSELETLSEAEKQRILDQEKAKIKAEYDSRLAEIEKLYKSEAANKEKLMRDMKRMKDYYSKKMENIRIEEISHYDEDLENEFKNIIEREESRNEAPLSLTGEEVVSSGSNVVINENQTTKPSYKRAEQSNELKNELLEKLNSLQSGMIGGEQIDNENVVERIKKKKRHAEDKRRQLIELNEKMEDGGIMLGVFEGIQDDLKSKSKELNRLHKKSMNLQQEILDLQDEYQRDKCDYLESIRKLEKDNLLLENILEKIQPLIRRNCNYSNIDKIKLQARYDENENKWILPPIKTDQSLLPGSEASSNLNDENYFNKLNNRPDNTYNYFASTRYPTSRHSPIPINTTTNTTTTTTNNNNNINNNDSLYSTQFENANNYLRNSHRLEALSSKPKKSKKKNRHDQYFNENLNDF